jgi:hypothetical protein
MTSNDPDAIRSEIERTRAALSDDVDALNEKVNPRRVVERQTDRIKGAVTSAKDSVFGTAEEAGNRLGERASTLGDRAASTTSSAREHLAEAPQGVVRQTRGNPWAAGLIAFGLGLLASSLIPASRAERDLLARGRESQPVQQLADTARTAASEVGDSLREPVRHAAERVKATAVEGAAEVKEAATSATEHVKDQAATARDRVVDEAQALRPS